MKTPQLTEIKEFLLCQTDKLWIDKATQNLDIVLVDHAHCEKKAASTALSLIYRYADKYTMLQKMSRLAREELRHFEQVLALIKKQNIIYNHLSPSRYAAGLQQYRRNEEPWRLLDTLIIGAFIEARSCERFAALAPYLEDELATFYHRLLASEARHFLDYLNFAKEFADEDIQPRIEFFAHVEADLIQTPDKLFRFHSGVPV